VSEHPLNLYTLLPAAYRIDDAAQGYPLKALMDILSEQANLLRQNIDDLWDDFFIETCAEWVIPYIGDLVGNIPIYEALRGRRADVARTIYFRRRKGTLPMLEELARYVTGWSVHAVEFFQILGWTQNLNHLRPVVGTVDLRDLDALDRIQTAFDRFSHTADVRPIAATEGWHNIKKIGFFAWRLASYQLTDVMPRPSAQDDHGYHFSPLGYPQPLFNNAQSETDETGVADEIHVDAPIRPTAFYFDKEDYYRPAAADGSVPDGISIFLDADDPMSRVAPDKIMCKQLPDWELPPAGKVAVDVSRGRFTFFTGEAPAAPGKLRVRFAYGFSADVGGGPYDRSHQREPDTIGQPEALDVLLKVSQAEPGSIPSALAAWDAVNAPGAVLEIEDSCTYAGDIVLDKPGVTLVIQARNGARPTIQGAIRLGATSPAHVILDGLVIEGHLEVMANSNVTTLSLHHCTLVPGRALDEAGQPASPLAPSILVAEPNPNLILHLDRCIAGPVQAPDSMTSISATDSILDAPGEAQARVVPVLVSGSLPSKPWALSAARPTLLLRIGAGEARTVRLASLPTTPAKARDALEAALRGAAPDQPAFAAARVVLADSRLVIVPGIAAPVTVSAAPDDATLDELRLNVTGGTARAGYALVGALRPGAFPAQVRTFALTMEEDAILTGTVETRTITIPAGATSLAGLAADLQDAIRAVSNTPAFKAALVTRLDDALVILPGAGATVALITTAAGDANSAWELGLISARPVLSGNVAGTLTGPPVTLENVTVFGTVFVKELTLASNTLFTAPVTCERRQSGCARFSYVPEGSATPRRYRCQPDMALAVIPAGDLARQSLVLSRLAPTFSARRYGQPAYAQLALRTAEELAAGADNGAEMGAFNHLLQPQRIANLRTRLVEYLPFGLEPGIIFVT